MKKEFVEIQIDVVTLESDDIIKTSGEVKWWPSLPGDDPAKM